MSLAAKLLLSPLLVAQALHTRSRLPRLPEAEGARTGTAEPGGAAAGAGASPLSLLIAGDSSAAGVGVLHQREALAGPLADMLAAHLRRPVRWRLVARSGLTTAQTHALLREQASNQECLEADVAIVVTGVNDVVDQIPSHRAVAAREALANWLRNAHGVRHVAFAPLPPVHHFPGLPQPLRWIAGADARRHDRALAEWAATRGDVSHVPLELQLNRGVMARDGFHPGARAYRQVAHDIALHIATNLAPRPAPRAADRDKEDGRDEHPHPEGQDALHHRREPRHRPGHREEGGGRRRQHRAGGQDDRAQPQAARHALQRR